MLWKAISGILVIANANIPAVNHPNSFFNFVARKILIKLLLV